MPALTPLQSGFVAKIADVDLSRPLDESTFGFIERAFQQYPVLVFPNQPLTEEQQLDFARRWGPVEPPITPYVQTRDNKRRLGAAEFADISNLDENGRLISKDDNRRLVNRANQLWHTDSTFTRTPAKMSMLSAQISVPTGGETEFADMRAAWEALPEHTKKKIGNLVAKHDYFHSRLQVGLDPTSISEERRKLLPAVPQRLIRVNPLSGRNSLYLASHIAGIYGMGDAEGKALVQELTQHATQSRFVYQHKWTDDDVVMWDNRYTMHRGRPYDDSSARAMRRATVMDEAPTVPIGEEPPEHTASA
jgi:alpha-ketoglutarate-dependent 2,4-dichlorophenoxyacetate dioxygenase